MPPSLPPSHQSQRVFLDRIGRKRGFTEMEDWYRVRVRDILANGGTTLLQKYRGSPTSLVCALFPEHQWVLHRFASVPHGYWEDLTNRRTFMEWLGVQLG